MTWHLVHIPKCAGQSMSRVLGVMVPHQRASEVERPRFAFVRHPLDRLVSAWAYAARKGNLARGRMTADGLRRFLATDHLIVWTQDRWLDAEVDFLGRFERLDEDWKAISDTPLPHVNQGEHGPWLAQFDDEMLKIATDYYARDFMRFGYSHEG